MGQITVFSGPERRRRWSDDERLRILAEAFSPGACVAEVCKLREMHAEPASVDLPEPGFAEAMVVADASPDGSAIGPAIIVDLARGKRVSIFASASPGQVAAALKALR
jgi:transposase